MPKFNKKPKINRIITKDLDKQKLVTVRYNKNYKLYTEFNFVDIENNILKKAKKFNLISNAKMALFNIQEINKKASMLYIEQKINYIKFEHILSLNKSRLEILLDLDKSTFEKYCDELTFVKLK